MKGSTHPASAPCALQIKHGTFLYRSETFIYGHLQQLRAYRPVVVTQDLANSGDFPFQPVEIVPGDPKDREFKKRVLGLKRSYAPAVIHAHFGPSGVYALNLKKLLGIPLITSFHGWDISGALREPHWVEAYRKLFREGDLFTGTSEYMRSQLEGAGCPPGKIRVVHVGIDPASFAFTARPRTGADTVRFLTVGRLVEKKGMADAIRAFAEVAGSHPLARLQIIGDGPLRPRLELLAETLGVRDAILFAGECSHDQVIAAMRDSDIFLLASRTAPDGDQEGTTMVSKEALSSGMPVVATRHAGIPEVVQDGVSGYLVPEGDVAQLAREMIRLIEHPETWTPMAGEGRRHVELNFDIGRETQKMEAVYREAVAGATAARRFWWPFGKRW